MYLWGPGACDQASHCLLTLQLNWAPHVACFQLQSWSIGGDAFDRLIFQELKAGSKEQGEVLALRKQLQDAVDASNSTAQVSFG